jgi:hypothetical protein
MSKLQQISDNKEKLAHVQGLYIEAHKQGKKADCIIYAKQAKIFEWLVKKQKTELTKSTTKPLNLFT